jgi:Domain of unknown function (DUF4412)
MKKEMGKGWLMTISVILWVLATVPGWAGKVTDFSADQVTLDAGGKVAHTSRIYFTEDKVRFDGAGGRSGSKEQMNIIFRRDLKKHFMLNPVNKTYFERDLDEKEMEAAIQQTVKNRSEKVLGQETVSGYPCTKKEVEAEFEIMGMKHKTRSVIWQSSDFIMPLRTQAEGGQTTEMRNIQKGKPEAGLFEVPKDYKQVANIMELMGEGRRRTGKEKSQTSGTEGGSQFPAKLPPGLKLPFPKQ